MISREHLRFEKANLMFYGSKPEGFNGTPAASVAQAGIVPYH